jgi:hypothetical protein
MNYGHEIDFAKNFLSQFKKLYYSIPVINLWHPQAVGSEYTNYAAKNKNCYLAFGGKECENVKYSNNFSFSKDSLDLFNCTRIELSYESMQCQDSQKLFFSKYCNNCSNSYFLYRCRNCIDCFGCVNLRNKQNCFFNEQLTKEEYDKKIKEFDSGSFKKISHGWEKFNKMYNSTIHKYAQFINTVNCTGEDIKNARDCRVCFDITGPGSENSKYVIYAVQGVKDSYDSYGMPKAERLYEALSSGFDMMENSDYMFTIFSRGSRNIRCSINCATSHDLFGCVGLEKKEYCIFNKQYTKEEYEKLIPKIIKQMDDVPYVDSMGRIYKYGEFFPTEFSPFAYNETIAQEHFSLTMELAKERGYTWKESDIKNYKVDLKSDDLPDHIKDVDESITSKIIECAHKGGCNEQCTYAYKIGKEDLEFYKKLNLPLPRLCPNCRHYHRLKQRNPFKLWHRQCMCEKDHPHHNGKCPNEFETSYAPDRKEIVYCESCYQQEIL